VETKREREERGTGNDEDDHSFLVRAKVLNELLKKARRRTIILNSADGQCFTRTFVHDWEGFDVGGGGDFAIEVRHFS
jgi:hypothetical protein